MEPVNWAQGEYINLLADIAAGKVLDIPQAVCSRYYACVLTPARGQIEVDINVNATTQWGQYMYVTGDTGALGNWNTNLGLPVDSASYPVWKNAINLAGRQRHSIQILPQKIRTAASPGNATRTAATAMATGR